MSHASITQAANDPQLQQRVQAAAYREVVYDATKADTAFGKALLGTGMTFANFVPIYWQVAVDTEAAYEAALLAGRGAPGHDADVITDGALTASVSAAWPEDPEPPT